MSPPSQLIAPRRLTSFVVLVSFVAALPVASGASRSPNEGIIWAQDSGIWGAGVDGRQPQKITAYYGNFAPDWFNTPRWSPSGQMLAYDTCGSDSCFVHLVRPAGGRKQTLPSRGSLIEFSPAWSPDGRELAFVTGQSGAPVLGRGISAVALIAPAKRKTITAPKYGRWDDSPDWSPDGKTIAFSRHTRYGSVIYLVGQDGRGLKRLTAGTSPSWSPDGRFLVVGNNNGIYTVGVDGRGRTLVARLPADDHGGNPRWSPDGR
jgi:TolB protein